MRSRIGGSAAVFCLSIIFVPLASLYAQQSPPARSPDNTFIPGVIVTPITDMPFSASVETVSKRPLPDGSIYTGHTIIHIARSSSGATYTERRKREPLDFQGEFRLLRFHIYDPQTHIRTTLFPETHVAHQTIVSGQKVPMTGGDTAATFLSKRQHVPDKVNGAEQEISIADDYVYNEDLGIYLLQRHSDPRTGEWSVNVRIVNVDHQEPDPSIFQIPNSYKIVEEAQEK
jgi:hypothetical protein